MPNILAHCGVQGALTHALIKDAPPAWLTVGCLSPDMPWLLVRMLKALIPQPLVATSLACWPSYRRPVKP